MEGGERKMDGYKESKRTGWTKEEDEVETDNIGVTSEEVVWVLSKMKRRMKNEKNKEKEKI